MEVPANLSGDKLALDYLARVTEAGLRYLPKGARMAFVGRTRAMIEQECGPGGLADPARVAEVLAGLGEPEELVRQERARIDADWNRRRSGGRDADGAVTVTAPREPRPITSRWKPATDTQPMPRPSVPWWAGGGRDSGRDDAGAPGRDAPEPVRGVKGTSRQSAARTVARQARRHPLEIAAIILTGIGGLILPFPFWLLGALTAVWSKLFDARDKWLVLLGPPLTAVAGTVLVAAIIRGQGNPLVIYFHAFGMDTGILLRAGSLLCGAYLLWRLQRGPRVRLPPWKR